jgi:glycine/D-amino acid oxidase-like deaminating enzyme
MAEIIVIGAGVMGTSIAYHLASRRVGRVVLVEKSTVCSGTSAKSSAIVRTHYSTRPTAAMALLSRRMIAAFRDEVGIDSGFVKTGMMLIGTPDERASVHATVAMNRELGIETSLISREDARAIDPLLDPPADVPIVWEPESGYASPHEIAHGYASRLRDLGGELRQDAEVTAIDIRAGRVAGVRTTRGDLAAAHVVIAAGPWAQPVGRLAGLDLPVMPSRQSIVTLRPHFAYGASHPVVIDLAREVYARPETGGLMLVGSVRHGDDQPGDPDRYQDRPEPEFIEDVVERLAGLMPEAAEAEIAGGWSGMYEITPDWNPIMGSAAGIAGLHYCVGFSGHGFKLAPIAGKLMAEHIVDGRASTLDLEPYRLERFIERKSLRVAYARAGVIA